MSENRKAPMRTTLVSILMLATTSCGTTRITFREVNPDVVYLGSADAAKWLGRPAFADGRSSSVSVRDYPTSMQWADRCGADLGARVSNAVGNSFDVIPLRDSIRGLSNKETWRKIRENRIFLRADPPPTAEAFAKMVSNDPAEQERVKLAVSLLRAPLLEQNMDPSSELGFSKNGFEAGLGATVSDALKANVKMSRTSLHFFVVSRWGQLQLTPTARTCLMDAARTMVPRPQYVVDAVSLGVFYEFAMEGTGFETKLDATSGKVVASANVNLSDVRINSSLAGEVNPEGLASFKTIAEGGADADVKVLKYFRDFSKGVETPVLVSAHLAKLD